MATCLISAFALYPLVLPLLLAVWCASIARPVYTRLTRRLGGRSGIAALMAVGLVVAIVAPIAAVIVELTHSATELATVIASGNSSKSRLRALVQEEDRPKKEPLEADAKQLKKLVQQHGAEAQVVGKGALLFTAGMLIFLFILAFGTYAALAEGERAWD